MKSSEACAPSLHLCRRSELNPTRPQSVQAARQHAALKKRDKKKKSLAETKQKMQESKVKVLLLRAICGNYSRLQSFCQQRLDQFSGTEVSQSHDGSAPLTTPHITLYTLTVFQVQAFVAKPATHIPEGLRWLLRHLCLLIWRKKHKKNFRHKLVQVRAKVCSGIVCQQKRAKGSNCYSDWTVVRYPPIGCTGSSVAVVHGSVAPTSSSVEFR